MQEIGPASRLVLDPLLRALHDDSERIRDVAADGLGGVGPPAVPGLIKAWDDPERRMRLALSRYWVSYAQSQARRSSAMIKSLADPDGEVRNQAVTIVGSDGSGAPPAIPALLAFLRTRTTKTASTSRRLSALATIGKPAVPSLLEVLQKEDDPSLRPSAALPWGGSDDRSSRPPYPF